MRRGMPKVGIERHTPFQMRGVVMRNEDGFLWIREKSDKESVRVAVENPERYETGTLVSFTRTGAWGVKNEPGTFVHYGTIEEVAVEKGESKEVEREGMRPKDILGLSEDEFLGIELWPEGTTPETPFGKLEIPSDEQCEGDECELYPDAPREALPSIETVPAEHPVFFDEERRQFFIREGKKTLYLKNTDARAALLLPGDKVGLSADARIAGLEYRNTDYIAGFLTEGERNVYDEKGKKAGTEPYRYLAVRVPGPRRTLEKFKLPADFEGVEEKEWEGRVILVDRRTKQLIMHPDIENLGNGYDALKRVVLTNMGAYEYDEESDQEKLDEQEELAWLTHEYGGEGITDPEELDAKLEDALSKLVDTEVAEGKIFDMRSDKGGKRQTFYIDPEGSRDHDDALSIEELEEGGFEVGVHIADVSRFVSPGGAIDAQAAFRATSIYLDDEVIRMLPALISEHLASLNADTTRLAFSLLFKAELDEKKHARISDIRFARTAIRVTEGLTYEQAEARIADANDTSAGAEALRNLDRVAKAMHKRMGIKQLGDDPLESEDLDIHEVVAEFMVLKNRAAGAAYERMKHRTNRDVQPNLRRVQDLVAGVYRTQEFSNKKTEQIFIEKLLRLKILFPADMQRDGKAIPFERLFRLAHERVVAGEFYAPRTDDAGKLLETTEEDYRRLSKTTIESYFIQGDSAFKNSAGYSSQPGIHISMGVTFSRITSPIRRTADGAGQRRMIFLTELAKKMGSEDISETEAVALVKEYAEQIVGLSLDPSVFEAPAEVVFEAVRKAADEHDAKMLAHTVMRESMARKAEGVVASLHTAANLYGFLRSPRGKWDSVWKRGSSKPAKNPFELQGDYTRADGEQLIQGLTVDFSEKNVRKDKDGNIYGEVLISKRSNRALLQFVPGRIKEVGARLQVRLNLPKGFRHPVAWCRERGMSRSRIKLQGSIVDVEVEKGRLVFKLADTLTEKEAYLDPKEPRFNYEEARRRKAA